MGVKMKIVNIAICLFLFNGCTVSPMYGKKVYTTTFEVHLLGLDALEPWLSGDRGGLWWSDGKTQRVYVEGVMYKEKLIPENL